MYLNEDDDGSSSSSLIEDTGRTERSTLWADKRTNHESPWQRALINFRAPKHPFHAHANALVRTLRVFVSFKHTVRLAV